MRGVRVVAAVWACVAGAGGPAFAQKTIDLGAPAGRARLEAAAPGGRAGAWIYHGDLTGDYWRKELIVGSPDESSGR
ncbi:MAG TPA: hypothetical protein VNI83_00080, partial [Vicinamibacterales bacterium]|nr:hypothetical protein [Vicinamibacterales bacterium]